MNIAEGFIRRPVATTLVMAAILLSGIAGYRLLPVSDLPNVDFPTIQVVATLPGANPDTMAASVATPLEKQFSTIAGLDTMSSVNALGLTQITLQFALDRNIDAAGQDVQAAIGKASSQLPPTMPTQPSYQKVNPADQPVIFMSIHSPTRPLSEVDNYAQTLIAQRLSMISGVAQVGVIGSQKYAVRVQLDPSALASRGIGIDEVASAIQKGNVNLPTGTLSGANEALTVEANGQLTNAAAYRPLVVTYRNGSPVRLEDLGKVVDGVENDKVASWFNTEHGLERAITLTIQRQPGANTVAVVRPSATCCPPSASGCPPRFSSTSCSTGRSPSRNRSTTSSRPCSSPWPWSSWSSSSSSTTCPPPSSRAWPCPWPSWARSSPCTCWAIRSTTSRSWPSP